MCNIKHAKLTRSQIVNMDHIFPHIDDAIYAKQDILLHGPGGYAKSEIARLVSEEHYPPEEIAILNCGIGTTVETFLGEIDLNKINDPKDAKIQYALHNSIFNKKIVILEELFDTNESVLMFLKNIISSRVISLGQEHWPIKTEVIIIATNWDVAEFAAQSPAHSALVDRWRAFNVNAVWLTHKPSDYEKMIKALDLKLSDKVTKVFTEFASKNSTSISPRLLVKAIERLKIRAARCGRLFGRSEDAELFNEIKEFNDPTFIKDLKDALVEEYNEHLKSVIYPKYKEIAQLAHNVDKMFIEITTDLVKGGDDALKAKVRAHAVLQSCAEHLTFLKENENALANDLYIVEPLNIMQNVERTEALMTDILSSADDAKALKSFLAANNKKTKVEA